MRQPVKCQTGGNGGGDDGSNEDSNFCQMNEQNNEIYVRLLVFHVQPILFAHLNCDNIRLCHFGDAHSTQHQRKQQQQQEQ